MDLLKKIINVIKKICHKVYETIQSYWYDWK